MWKSALVHATLISLLISGIFYYWFVVANRHIIFLYNHYGATPFDGHTTSRYLMAGLVASGAVMVLYTMANWYIARIAGLRYQHYIPPTWWTVWLLCLVPVTVSIVFITGTRNQPTLPWSLSCACAAVTLVGLAFALPPAALAASQPQKLVWLTVTGAGLIPSLLLLKAVELPAQGLAMTGTAYCVAIGSTVLGAVWLSLLNWWQARRHQQRLKASELFITGMCLSYLLLPLLHYLLLVPPKFRYITASANFFALHPFVQLLCLGITGYLAWLSVQVPRKSQG